MRSARTHFYWVPKHFRSGNTGDATLIIVPRSKIHRKRENILDIIAILREDYAKFPIDQSYQIYAEDVYFQDPTSKFRGLDRYKKTISFIQTWFKEPRLELYEIVGGSGAFALAIASPVENRLEQLITTRWSLSWNTPLPWYPRIEITGRSEMLLNEAELIISHIDYWDCAPIDVLKQHFKFVNGG